MNTYFDLGEYSRSITTSSSEAQLWFDRGLNWCYGFNHEEGVKCFHKALEFDPDCAMAHWGIAYGSGPFYNLPWVHLSADELDKYTKICFEHVMLAKSLYQDVTEIEKDIIDALLARSPKGHGVPPSELEKWDDDYANAMRCVYQKYPEDHDIMALFAEALMTRTPWQLWNIKTNQPAENSDVLEALKVIDKSILLSDKNKTKQHPAILHLHIHATEMSPNPEAALKSADLLGHMCPDAGHMNHMPGHTYVLCSEYEKAKLASEKAIRADRMYLEYAGPYNFYTTARCHDLHLMMYTCMFLGQFEPAIDAANEMCETLSRDVLEVKDRPQLAITMEGYYSMAMHVLVRFGKWQEIIDRPMPECPDLYCVSTPMHHYAKAIAYATLGHHENADKERLSFYIAFDKVPANRKFFNNFAKDTLSVAQEMMEGEVEYHKGNYDVAFDHLRKAVFNDDNLAYTEPWAWMHPPRHALGALLSEQGHFEEAEDVYRTDLGLNNNLARCLQHHNNVWALHGLKECLTRKPKSDELELVTAKLNIALSKTDLEITSSCCCRKDIYKDTCCTEGQETE